MCVCVRVCVYCVQQQDNRTVQNAHRHLKDTQEPHREGTWGRGGVLSSVILALYMG